MTPLVATFSPRLRLHENVPRGTLLSSVLRSGRVRKSRRNWPGNRRKHAGTIGDDKLISRRKSVSRRSVRDRMEISALDSQRN